MVVNEGDIATRMGGDLALGRVYLCQLLVLAETFVSNLRRLSSYLGWVA